MTVWPGPVLLLVLAPLLWACHRRPAPAPPRPRPGPANHAPSFAFILALAAVFLGTYSLNLVISELYVEDSFGFLVVKNTLGGLHLVLVPGLVLACHQDIRRGLGAVFGSSVLCRVASPASDTQHQVTVSTILCFLNLFNLCLQNQTIQADLTCAGYDEPCRGW